MTATWHIITGEYPPQLGGVGDYTERLAAGLAAQGCQVHVWCPHCHGKSPQHDRVEVHRIAGGFSSDKLFELGESLSQFSSPRTILVEYAPNAFAMRGLNIPFCFWLLGRCLFAKDDVRVMFHEPFFYFGWKRPQRNVLALVNRLMAVVLLAASRVVYVSTPAWECMLRRYAWFRQPPMVWLPIPTTIPYYESKEAVSTIRRERTGGDSEKLILGHFGTYGTHMMPDLYQIFVELLQKRANVLGMCLGARGDTFVANVLRSHPHLQGRLFAPGFLSRKEVSLHLQACDLIIQPYPDGASSRRTSLMAVLVNGVPTITTLGSLTESIWVESGAVPLVSARDTTAMVALATELLEDRNLRKHLGERGRGFYVQHFSLARSIGILLQGISLSPGQP